MLKRQFQVFLENKFAVFIIIAGTIIWSLTMVKSGIVYDYGMGFWGPNGHDGIWHISVINSLAKGSMQMPIFAGETIKNYHIGYDLLLAVIHRITNIAVIDLYFQIIPPITAFLIGLLVYKFVFLWRSSRTQAFWAVFFVYFSGSFGWIATLLRGDGFGGESLFWAQQSLSTLINPPFAFSLVIIFLGLNYYMKYENTHNTSYIILYTILFSLLVQIKIYAGILIIIALFIAGIWEYLINRRTVLVKKSLIIAILSVILLLPTYDLRSGGLIFQPFWFLESMVATSDRFYWPKMASALANYKLAGNYIKLFVAYGLTFVIFIIGNAGIRILAFPWIFKKIKKYKKTGSIDVIIISIIFFGTLIPMFFIQKGNSWNAIQFFYYSLVFLSVITGIATGEYLEKIKKLKENVIPVSEQCERIRNQILDKTNQVGQARMTNMTMMNFKLFISLSLIFLFTIPTTVATLCHYLPSRPPAKISKEELTALEFLKAQPEGVILTLPFDKNLADKEISNPPRPLYLYESTAYVSALTGKLTYLEDEVNLDITGYNWKDRKEEILKNITDLAYLKHIGIDYIYVTPTQKFVDINIFEGNIIYNDNGYLIIKI